MHRPSDKNKEEMNRLEFLKKSAKALGCAALCPILAQSLTSCGSDDTNSDSGAITGKTVTLDLTKSAYSDLATTGEVIHIDAGAEDNLPSKGLLVYRKSETEVLAFSRVCTHSQGLLSHQGGDNLAVCALHGAVFSKEGKPTSGPAQSALTSYTASVSGNTITISV